MVDFRILGPFEVVVDGHCPAVGGPQQRALLAVLLLHRGELVSTDRLIDQLWGERAPPAAAKTVQVYVSSLRKILGDAVILTRGRGYMLDPHTAHVDVDRFEAMASEGRRALAEGDARSGREHLSAALGLWRGEPLAEFAYESFAHDEIARLEEARLTALEHRVDAELALGEHATLAGELESLVRNHPLRERLQFQLMLALYRSGRQADALESYRDARRRLISELGIEPAPPLQELQRAILAQDPRLDPPAARAPQPARAPPASAPAASPGRDASAVETVGILITDMVDSTLFESRWGADVAERVRREHFALLRETIVDSGGREVKTTGDGLMAAFGTATAAVECAVAIQQAVERRNRFAEHALHLRIGIGAGETRVEGGDYFGMPPVEAARLCERAPGDAILVSALAEMMSGRREGWSFEPAGTMELKGIPGPAHAFYVRWRSAPAISLPARLTSDPELGFVGREREQGQLAEAWRAARAGRCRLMLLSGEPGIGKTRLASCAALAAHREGATVLYGRCDEELGVAYQPWREALGHFVEDGPITVIREHVAAHGGELARLLPEFHRRLDDVPAPRDSDPETERYLLFTAVRGLLEAASSRSPVVLVLDDLHWADRPTLSLLRHLIDAAPRAHLLMIATFRSSGLSDQSPLTSLLADLRREQDAAIRLVLEGLGEEDIVALMEGIAGHDLGRPGITLARDLHRETNGNPFFIFELLRHLRETGALVQSSDGRWTLRGELSRLGLSESVREVIGGRVGRLGEETRRALTTAAVIGRDVEVALLAEVSGEDEDAVLDHLERGQTAALIAERPDRRGWFSFTHALVQHALYEDLGATRRARLHRRIAEALERRCGDQPGERVGELAHHWSVAAAPSERGRAAEYAMRAGRRALEELAPDEAQRWFERALALLGDGADDAQRREVLVLLGEAQRQTGDPRHRDTLVEAAGLAHRAGDVDRQARAVIAAWQGLSTLGRRDDAFVAALQDAAEALPDDDPRRAEVLAELAAELSFSTSLERRRALADEALALARRAGDIRLLCRVLVWHAYATEVAHTIDERLAHLEEARALADETADPWLQFQAETKSCSLLEAGDIDGFDRCIARMGELQAAVHQPIMAWVVRFTESARELIAGRLADAEKLALEALELSGFTPDGVTVFGGQIAAVRRDQGRTDELVDLAAQAVIDNPTAPAFRVVHAMALCGAERYDEARPLLAAAAKRGFGWVPLDHLWSSTLVAWSEVASALDERDAAGSLYEQLSPHRHTMAWTGATTSGPVARALGRLALLLDRYDEAQSHLALAFAAHERIAAPIWQADTERLLGLTLVRDPGGDADRGRELLQRAADAARRHGAAHIEREAEAALTEYALH